MDGFIKVGITACSNGLLTSSKKDVENLSEILSKLSIVPVFSEYIYAETSAFQCTATKRANALMNFYADDSVCAIFDISGGDIANEIIPYLDFDIIANSNKQFWGYSDLTTIINAIYTKTGRSSVLYQVRNLLASTKRKQDFKETFINGKNNLFDFPYRFICGDSMSGVAVGGNIRCLLKLAGTEYFPDLTEKILFIEAFSGHLPQMVTYLTQLKMLGAFKKVNGIMLGTFTKLEEADGEEKIISLVKQYAEDLPVAKTQFIGHGSNSYAVEIGRYYSLSTT